MDRKKTVLIVEDEKSIVDILRFNLEKDDYAVETAYDGETGLRLAVEKNPDLVLLDLMLPKMNGFDVCRRLREKGSNVPIIILTAREEEGDKVQGLELGADDYITKPFVPMEVLARVRSQLRRYTSLGGMEQKPNRIVIGGIALDDDTKTVTVDGEPVSLTPIEYNILLLLMRHPGRVYSSAQIYEKVWNESAFGSEGAVAVHIRQIGRAHV